MRLVAAQNLILLIFVASFLLLLTFVSISYEQKAIYSQDLRDLVLRFLAIYSVPLGVIVSGIFGKSSSPKRVASARAFWIAIGLAVIWNSLIIGRTLLFTFASEDQVSGLLDFVNEVASASSFMTAGSLTYFFAFGQGEKDLKGSESHDDRIKSDSLDEE